MPQTLLQNFFWYLLRRCSKLAFLVADFVIIGHANFTSSSGLSKLFFPKQIITIFLESIFFYQNSLRNSCCFDSLQVFSQESAAISKLFSPGLIDMTDAILDLFIEVAGIIARLSLPALRKQRICCCTCHLFLWRVWILF